MKRFKTISTTFIVAIAVIFSCNVYYLISLYNSIRTDVERDVMTALADADIDDLMYRAGRAQALASNVQMQEDIEEYNAPRKAEASTYKDENGQLISVRTEADGTVIEERAMLSENSSYSNQMVDAMSRQFHAIMDKYIPYDMEVMDSVLYNQLSNRFIYPDFLCVEVVNSNDSVICGNPKLNGELGLDSFSFNINPDEGIYYKAYMTPLTRHILSQMFGIIITVFLLMVAFSLAFWYLFRTVSRLRTIEEMKDDFVSNMTHELKTPIAIAYSANDAPADIVVADVMMPKMDGFTMAKEIRKLSPTVPLLFLTAKSTIDDVEHGFEIGANDYLKKPFELRELVRIKALLRRYGANRTEDIRFAIGAYTFNVTTQTLSFGDKETELSHFEAKILEHLATNIGKTVDASELMIAVWQRDEQSNRNSLHGYIHKLRRTLRHDPTISIINQRGFGYMLVIRN